MIKTTLVPENNTVVINIPNEMIGKNIDIIAFQRGEIIEDLMEDELVEIPEWHKDLVIAESKRISENPGTLMPWEEIKSKIVTKLTD